MPTPNDAGQILYPADGGGAGKLTIANASYGPRGHGANIVYTIVDSAYGRMLVAVTAKGVCWLSLGKEDGYLESELRRDYPEASITRDDQAASALAEVVSDYLSGKTAEIELPVDIRATPFQAAVWSELCAIERGATRSYGDIAKRVGRPDAPRAVGHAVGSNPISIFIPCHRAIGANGSLTGYRWGLPIKRRLLSDEGANIKRESNSGVQQGLKL